METQEVRIVNANQEQRKVYFHLYEGNKTIVRVMEAHEIINANRIQNTCGTAAYIKYYVDLFNSKYQQPQHIPCVKLTASEERFGCLHHKRQICAIPNDEEEEYQKLLNEDYLEREP